MNPTELIDRYCEVWSEPDPARRAALLESVWAPGATYTDPTVHASGSAELLAHIARVQARRPGARVVRTSQLDEHHGVARFAWRAIEANGNPLPEGIDVAFFAPGGKRIERIIGFFGPLKRPAHLEVIVSGGFFGPYDELRPEFERTSGVSVSTGSGASQGTGPQTIAAQLARGVPADVVILSREGLDELIAAGRIVAGTDVDLASAPIGAGVRAGAPKPEVGSVEALKRTLVGARLVAIPASTSGIYIRDTLLPRLGIADRVKIKVMERGAQAAAMAASGEADLALLPTSEILHAKGLDMAGRIPDEVQLIQPFAAAVVAGSKQVEAGKRLIAFLASELAVPAIEKGGMDALRK